MKGLILTLLIGVACVKVSAQDTHKFVVVVESTSDVRATGRVNMSLRRGEVFQFMRFASTSEFTGAPQSSIDPTDASYVVGAIGPIRIMAPLANFRWVQTPDEPEAERKYSDELQELEATLKTEIADEERRVRDEQEQADARQEALAEELQAEQEQRRQDDIDNQISYLQMKVREQQQELGR